MQFTPSTIKKISVVYGILVILIIVALAIRFWPGKNLNKPNIISQPPLSPNTKVLPTVVKSPLVGKISLQSSSYNYKAGDTGELTVLFEAAGMKLDGIDIVLRYDPGIINVAGFSEGKYFKLYPRKDIDNSLGIVKVIALEPAASSTLDGSKVELGVIHFMAKNTGSTGVNFDFISGTTGKTSLTQQGTSQNILGSASGMTIRVSQ